MFCRSRILPQGCDSPPTDALFEHPNGVFHGQGPRATFRGIWMSCLIGLDLIMQQLITQILKICPLSLVINIIRVFLFSLSQIFYPVHQQFFQYPPHQDCMDLSQFFFLTFKTGTDALNQALVCSFLCASRNPRTRTAAIYGFATDGNCNGKIWNRFFCILF